MPQFTVTPTRVEARQFKDHPSTIASIMAWCGGDAEFPGGGQPAVYRVLTKDGQRRELAPGTWLVQWPDETFTIHVPAEFDEAFQPWEPPAEGVAEPAAA